MLQEEDEEDIDGGAAGNGAAPAESPEEAEASWVAEVEVYTSFTAASSVVGHKVSLTFALVVWLCRSDSRENVIYTEV